MRVVYTTYSNIFLGLGRINICGNKLHDGQECSGKAIQSFNRINRAEEEGILHEEVSNVLSFM